MHSLRVYVTNNIIGFYFLAVQTLNSCQWVPTIPTFIPAEFEIGKIAKPYTTKFL